MKNAEKAVRDAAAALHDAIIAAKRVGLNVTWPSRPDGLLTIPVSETAKANEDAAVTVVAKGVLPGSPEHSKATHAAQKAVDTVGEPAPSKK